MRALGRVVVRLRRAHLALDDRVDVLQVTRVRRERDRQLAAPRLARRLGAEVVLDVAGAALEVGRDCFEDALALELPQDRIRLPADRVREDVEPASVRHAEDDVVGAVGRRELDRLVQHRNHHVEALDRELLLAEEGPAEVALEPLDLGQAAEERRLLGGAQRLPVLARTRSPPGARGAARGSRCARARRPASRSRSRGAAGAPRPGSPPPRRAGGPSPESAPGARRSGAAGADLDRAPDPRAARSRAGRCGQQDARASGAPSRATWPPRLRRAGDRRRRAPPRAPAEASPPRPGPGRRSRSPSASARAAGRRSAGARERAPGRTRRACATRGRQTPGRRGSRPAAPGRSRC